MKKTLLVLSLAFYYLTVSSCSENVSMNSIPYEMDGEPLPTETGVSRAILNLNRSMAITDSAMAHYFTGDNMSMSRYFNPVTKSLSTEVGSVWMYTSAIEAVNSVMQSLNDLKEIEPQLYEDNYSRYQELLSRLYDGLDYYRGTYTLTSYTQTKDWSVYAVDRANEKGTADVTGVLNVYDDQEWLIRELLRSYKVTGNEDYLQKAEYLTDYVLDGWDCYPDENGNEIGGITWGPGYVTKHSCSNGPLISSLVWLYDIYSDKDAQITYREIDPQLQRKEVTEKKSVYYLEFAKKIYNWQKQHLIMDSGVYYDLIGASAESPQYEIIDGVNYRKGLSLTQPSGNAYTYNSGTMLSGSSELYKITGEDTYLSDASKLSDVSFSTFAKKDVDVPGYYSFPIDGFSTWFNDVLLRGYIDAQSIGVNASVAIDSYQANLDYAWAKYRRSGLLPVNLLLGWNISYANNNVEAMFSFSYASEYAMLAHSIMSNMNK